MCVHSLCEIVFHAVTHYEFDANLIRSGIIHERCERVPAIMGKMFHVELIHNCIEIRTNIGTVCVVIAIFVVYQKSTVGIVPVLYERQDFVCNRNNSVCSGFCFILRSYIVRPDAHYPWLSPKVP